MNKLYGEYLIRDWREDDREAVATLIAGVLEEYGLPWQGDSADRDVLNVEECYFRVGGEFWTIEFRGEIVGTAAYYPISRGFKAVEIRKMYFLPSIRGQGLGKYILRLLEETIEEKGYREIWIETASILREAVRLYEGAGYEPAAGVETARCDRVYRKHLSDRRNELK